MGLAQQVQVPSLNCAGVSAALRRTGYVDLVASGEGIDSDEVANVCGAIIKAEFLKMLLHGNACFFEMSDLGFCQMLCLNFCKAKLQSIVAVLFNGLLLCYYARTSFDNGYGNDVSNFVENLRHTELFTDNSLFHFVFPPVNYWLTSASPT